MRLVLGVALLLVGCGGPLSGEALEEATLDRSLSTDRGSYVPGAEIKLTLTNRRLDGVRYDFCMTVAERRVGTEWEQEPWPEDSFCPFETQGIPALQSRTETKVAPAAPGEYRYRGTVHVKDMRVVTVSNLFTVTDS